MALAALFLAACGSKKAEPAVQEETPAQKALVLYYSQSGTTKKVAECIQQKMNADIELIQVKEAYDGDYQQTISRVQQEKADNVLPELVPIQSNLDEYDVIFLGYPIWFGTYCPAIGALIKDVDLKGKKIVTFASFGSGGIVESTNALKEAGLNVVASYGVRTAQADMIEAGVSRLLIENGFMEGEVEALADYTELQPCTEEETAIFNEAISTYDMLKGTVAKTVGGRTTSTGTDYLFEAESEGRDGQKTQCKILVTKPNDGGQAFFTRVDR